MKTKIFAAALCAVLVAQTAAFADDYEFGVNEYDGSGGALTELVGADGRTVRSADSSLTWSVKNDAGIYRMYYYMTPYLGGSTDATLSIDAEFIKKSFPLDFSLGSGGWREISIVQCGPAGMTAKLNPGESGLTLYSGIKFEKLDSSYADLWRFVQNKSEHIMLTTHSKTAYVDGVRVKLGAEPKVNNGELYVSVSDLGSILGVKVTYGGDRLAFDYEGAHYEADAAAVYVGGNATNAAVLSEVCAVPSVSLSALMKAAGKDVFSHEDELFIFTDGSVEGMISTVNSIRNIVKTIRFGN